jgi:hypothetical protein
VGKQKGEGAYHNNPGKDKVTEMDRERTRPKDVSDGVSLADILDRNSNAESNYGLTSSIKRKK